MIESNNRKNNNKMPWITKGILRSIHTRNRLYKTSLRHPTFLNKDMMFMNKSYDKILRSITHEIENKDRYKKKKKTK